MQLLSGYNLLQFVGVAKAVRYALQKSQAPVLIASSLYRQGNMRQLSEALQQHEVGYHLSLSL